MVVVVVVGVILTRFPFDFVFGFLVVVVVVVTTALSSSEVKGLFGISLDSDDFGGIGGKNGTVTVSIGLSVITGTLGGFTDGSFGNSPANFNNV